MDQTEILHPYISREEINTAVTKLAIRLTYDYEYTRPVFIGVLKSASVFLSDLIRKLHFSVEIAYVDYPNYLDMSPSEAGQFIRSNFHKYANRHIILTTGIVNSGNSLYTLMQTIRSINPTSLTLCSLLVKSYLSPDMKAMPKRSVSVDYTGRIVDDKFLVGYGLDYNGKYRNLSSIYYIKD